jgi:hypothetical protein
MDYCTIISIFTVILFPVFADPDLRKEAKSLFEQSRKVLHMKEIF